jgi:hypothetical protein
MLVAAGAPAITVRQIKMVVLAALAAAVLAGMASLDRTQERQAQLTQAAAAVLALTLAVLVQALLGAPALSSCLCRLHFIVAQPPDRPLSPLAGQTPL